MANLGKFPENVMMEILSQLPLESLVRFKCVSKLWYSRINDPRVVLLLRSVKNKDNELNEFRFSFLKYDPFVADGQTSFKIEDAAQLPTFVREDPGIYIKGQSHGIVCLFGSAVYGCIYLYHPITGDIRQLPPSILLSNRFDYSTNQEVLTLSGPIGFGYDHKAKDFKVVRVVNIVPSSVQLYDLDPPANIEVYNQFLPSRAEIYDLKKDEWREIETPIPGFVFGAPSFEMFYQGFFYWWGISKEGEAVEIIMSFDMSEELFSLIPVPESFHNDRYTRSLGVLNGSIILLHYAQSRGKTSFDLWEMVKSGDVVSWSKLITIRPNFRIDKPLAFVGSNELLMATYQSELILYNFKTQQFKYFSLGNKKISPIQATVFTTTLLSAKAMEDIK